MKIGEYVRTKDGFIAKLVNKNDYLKTYYFDGYIWERGHIPANTISYNLLEKHIRKDIEPSPNIIELFEEHDLVVIEYYSLRYNERVTRLFEVTFKDSEYIHLSNAKCEFMLINGEFNKGDKQLTPIIKSIVTKERFKEMEYKL